MNHELRSSLKLANPNLLAEIADHPLATFVTIALEVNTLTQYRVHVIKVVNRGGLVVWQGLTIDTLCVQVLIVRQHA